MRASAVVVCLALTGCCLSEAAATPPSPSPSPPAPSPSPSPSPALSLSPSPTPTPPDWPTDFPILPGGVPRAAPSMGPVRLALIAYPERDVESTDRAQRDALAAAGWTVADARPADTEAHRFVAEHGTESVSVSIYRDGTDTIVQTMQL